MSTSQNNDAVTNNASGQVATETADEIEKIMREIVSLQENMTPKKSDAPAPTPAPALSLAPAPQSSTPSPESMLEDVLAELESAESSVPMEENDGSLTLSLTGQMKLKLKYECDGQEVSLRFGDDFLRVELSDGTEFKIPVGKSNSGRHLRAA